MRAPATKTISTRSSPLPISPGRRSHRTSPCPAVRPAPGLASARAGARGVARRRPGPGSRLRESPRPRRVGPRLLRQAAVAVGRARPRSSGSARQAARREWRPGVYDSRSLPAKAGSHKLQDNIALRDNRRGFRLQAEGCVSRFRHFASAAWVTRVGEGVETTDP